MPRFIAHGDIRRPASVVIEAVDAEAAAARLARGEFDEVIDVDHKERLALFDWNGDPSLDEAE